MVVVNVLVVVHKRQRFHQPVLLSVLLAVADEHHSVVDIWLGLVASVEDAALVGTPAGGVLQKERERETDHLNAHNTFQSTEETSLTTDTAMGPT